MLGQLLRICAPLDALAEALGVPSHLYEDDPLANLRLALVFVLLMSATVLAAKEAGIHSRSHLYGGRVAVMWSVIPRSYVRNALPFACDLSARLAKLSPAAPIYFRRTCGPDIGKVERLDEVGNVDCSALY